MISRVVNWTTDNVVGIVKRILPHGPAWASPLGSRMGNFVAAIAPEVVAVQNAFTSLVDEADWRTTDQLLEAWERIAGLPDPCAPEPVDDDERREILHAHMTATGGQSGGYFVGVAETLIGSEGDIVYDEFQAFRVGRNRVGDALNDGAWDFTWRLTLYNWTFGSPFHVGSSRVGEPLGSFGDFPNGHLECLIDKIKPSHTVAIVGYSTSAPPT